MQKVHFIGIGGIGMSALARYYLSIGFSVSGSDNSKSEISEAFKYEGIDIKIGEQVAENISDDVTKIIYTIAVRADNPELIKAKSLQEKKPEVVVMTYPQALGEMTNNKKVIAICGTHGKTTTTAMTYFALQNAGVDVSMIVGSLIEINGKKTNHVHGQSEWIVIEACEYRRSFLNYNPNIVLVTNIDNDHMDYFKDMDDINSAFQEFVGKLGLTPNPSPSERGSASIMASPEGRGNTQGTDGGWRGPNSLVIHKSEEFLNFKNKVICEDFSKEEDMELQVPGVHNRKNAQLVVALGEVLGLDKNKILDGLKNFKGTWRRQEYKGEFFGADFYDDYAHHPTEIRATLQAFREKFVDKKIIAIFQPHLFSRTKLLFNDFINSFSDADEVIVLPIYASREKFDDSVNSEKVVEGLNKIDKKSAFVNKEDLYNFLEKNISENEVVITLGAGSIYDIYSQLK